MGKGGAEMNWINKIGRRNVAYVVFVAILIPLAWALEESGPSGPDAGGGVMFGLIVWALVSVVFFVWNLVLVIRDLSRGNSAAKPFIACALPIAVVVGTLIVEDIVVSLNSYGADPAVVDDEATQRG
jgi:hypothetical protein